MSFETGENDSRPDGQLRRSGWKMRLILGLAAGVILIPASVLGGNSVYQNFFAPRADENLVALSLSGKSADHVDTPSETELPGMLAGISQKAVDSAPHPLDPLLDLARVARQKIAEEIPAYSTILANTVRLNDGSLREEQFMFCKIRNPNPENGIPFSIYTKFIKPQSVVGQEAIWVEGRNGNKLVAHPPGFFSVTVWLDPDSPLAMKGNRYPIYDIGLLKLMDKLIDKGERDKLYGMCEVRIDPSARVGEKSAVMIEVTHPVREGPYDFHIARIFIDPEAQLPIAYEGFDWPKEAGGEPPLLERYIYQELTIVDDGWTDADFDPANKEYNFPWAGSTATTSASGEEKKNEPVQKAEVVK